MSELVDASLDAEASRRPLDADLSLMMLRLELAVNALATEVARGGVPGSVVGPVPMGSLLAPVGSGGGRQGRHQRVSERAVVPSRVAWGDLSLRPESEWVLD